MYNKHQCTCIYTHTSLAVDSDFAVEVPATDFDFDARCVWGFLVAAGLVVVELACDGLTDHSSTGA